MIQIDNITLWQGDCLNLMCEIPDKSVDMILCDLPYGTTQCKWDTIIPFEPLWEQYNRIIKDCGAVVLFGSEPFSSSLRMSNISNYKYDWIWDKKIPSGMCNAKIQPMRQTENISVFINGKSHYNPQMIKRDKPIIWSGAKSSNGTNPLASYDKKFKKVSTHKYPTNIIKVDKVKSPIHPTQKPVELLEYLIKTYTIEGETVLDNCMGSGSTGVACVNTNRNFIGMELDNNYFNTAKERIYKAKEGDE